MADEKYTFEQARVRLEEIVTQVRRKDVSLEASIDLLEEGVRLANMCTELSDHTEWRAVVEDPDAAADSNDAEAADQPAVDGDTRPDEPGERAQEPVEPPRPDTDSQAQVEAGE